MFQNVFKYDWQIHTNTINILQETQHDATAIWKRTNYWLPKALSRSAWCLALRRSSCWHLSRKSNLHLHFQDPDWPTKRLHHVLSQCSKMWAHLRITGLSWRPISLEFRGQAQALGQTLPLLWTRTRMAPVISLTPDSRNHGPIKKLNRSFYSFCSIYIDGFPCPVFPHPPSPPNGMVPILHIQGSS